MLEQAPLTGRMRMPHRYQAVVGREPAEHLVEELARLDLVSAGKHQLNSGRTLLVS